jgi:hypothetical protein
LFQLLQGLRASLVASTPEVVLQRLRARRRSEMFRQAGVVFVHVPRTAGTSVTSTLYGRFIGHFGLTDLIAVAGAEVLDLPRFTVVRNPWDRLVSAWSFARAGGGASRHGAVRVHRPEQYAVAEFDTFASFVEQWLALRDPAKLDGIFRPQHSYLLDDAGQLDFSHVGHLEQMGRTEAWLTEVLARPIAFGHQNASPRSDYRDYYTPRLRDQVAELYARDIELLGYEF